MDNYFNKKFKFLPNSTWHLPSTNSAFQSSLWNLENLSDIKTKLNLKKSSLNDKGEKWHKHTSEINRAALVIEVLKKNIHTNILTQAWCKFYEILNSYDLINYSSETFQSLHLCEAPGAFICALNCYLSLNLPDLHWEWTANSLNPYYEGHSVKNVVSDDRLMFPTLQRWCFGVDNTGDITDPSFCRSLLDFMKGTQQFHLITADGSVCCMDDPAEQELTVAGIHFAEVIVALHCLSPGGNFVLKKFTFFECITVCKMYFLNCVFNEVHVFKPFTSKPGNSEVYVVCMGFKGTDKIADYLPILMKNYSHVKDTALFPLSSIPESFIQQISECANLFGGLQMESLEENLRMYADPTSFNKDEWRNVQSILADEYLKRCRINTSGPPISCRLFHPKKQIKTSYYTEVGNGVKFMYYRALGESFQEVVKSKSVTWHENLLEIEKRLDSCFPLKPKRVYSELSWNTTPGFVRNRMKSKSYKNWCKLGKKFDKISNSKFCHPLLLYLWNCLLDESKVDVNSHIVKSACHWELDSLIQSLKEDSHDSYEVVNCLPSDEESTKSDSLFHRLQEAFYEPNISQVAEDSHSNTQKKILFMNSAGWFTSLHNEMEFKYVLLKVLHDNLNVLCEGDCLIMCIQSLWTRFSVGIMFAVLSLFEQFTCLLPYKGSPALCGQIWVLSGFQNVKWKSNLLEHLDKVLSHNRSDSKDILEVVPISSLCSNWFYELILENNNCHLQRKIRSLIAVEKKKLGCKK